MNTRTIAKGLWLDLKRRIDQIETFGVFNDVDLDEEEKLDKDCIAMIADALQEIIEGNH
jgi:hypothetical protein